MIMENLVRINDGLLSEFFRGGWKRRLAWRKSPWPLVGGKLTGRWETAEVEFVNGQYI